MGGAARLRWPCIIVWLVLWEVAEPHGSDPERIPPGSAPEADLLPSLWRKPPDGSFCQEKKTLWLQKDG